MPHEDLTMTDDRLLHAVPAIAQWITMLTPEEWTLLRHSQRCAYCGHLLVLQRWREAQTLTPAGHRKVLTCCAVGACACETHWLPVKDGATEMSQ